MITKINVKNLYPHHDNPRKDLGDISELAESVKERGILQNLTVVPQEEKPWNEIDPKTDHFTVVIGHRRLAAAKQAGLDEVPCAIVTMTEKEQVSTMLLENMQRSDLTIYEQAQGFQMMLDLGATQKEIAEKTGLSATTVSHRVKMLDLDQDILKEKGQQITISDMIALEPIKNPKTKNELLQGWTNAENMKYRIQRAIDDEKKEVVLAELIPQLKALGVKETSKSSWELEYKKSRTYSLDEAGQEIKLFGKGEYVYSVSYSTLCVYKLDTDAAKRKKDEKKEQAEENRKVKALQGLFKDAEKLRCDFVLDLYQAGAEIDKDALLDYFRSRVIAYKYLSMSDWYGIENLFGVDGDDGLSKISPEFLLLAALVFDMQGTKLISWGRKYEKSETLEQLYDYLVTLGYEISDMERQLLDGTHELYEKGDEEK